MNNNNEKKPTLDEVIERLERKKNEQQQPINAVNRKPINEVKPTLNDEIKITKNMLDEYSQQLIDKLERQNFALRDKNRKNANRERSERSKSSGYILKTINQFVLTERLNARSKPYKKEYYKATFKTPYETSLQMTLADVLDLVKRDFKNNRLILDNEDLFDTAALNTSQDGYYELTLITHYAMTEGEYEILFNRTNIQAIKYQGHIAEIALKKEQEK